MTIDTRFLEFGSVFVTKGNLRAIYAYTNSFGHMFIVEGEEELCLYDNEGHLSEFSDHYKDDDSFELDVQLSNGQLFIAPNKLSTITDEDVIDSAGKEFNYAVDNFKKCYVDAYMDGYRRAECDYNVV